MELIVLDFAVLGLLMGRARHGYELKRALGELGFWKVSF
jgi:DNA-binding PadR family transcriptional regulator